MWQAPLCPSAWPESCRMSLSLDSASTDHTSPAMEKCTHTHESRNKQLQVKEKFKSVISGACLSMYKFFAHSWLLLQSSHHDDGAAPLFPQHSPEITHSLRQGALCSDVGILLPVSVYVVCINVVAPGYSYTYTPVWHLDSTRMALEYNTIQILTGT